MTCWTAPIFALMVVAQQLVTGEDTQYRQGPGGHWWKFRMYQNGRGLRSAAAAPKKWGMADVVSMAVRAVRREGLVLQCLDATLLADLSVVYAAVTTDGLA